MDFRRHTPKRRNITTTVTSYREHRSDLVIDYRNRCGYCDDINTWRFAWFEIDHLVPQKYLLNIKETEYSNLVYACRSCNNAKRAKWPTGDENIHNQNHEGFIDPCHDDYNDQFSRSPLGRILPNTQLGKWMYHTIKLYKPQHEIIWNIEQIAIMIEEIEELLSHSPNNDLSVRLLHCYREYKRYVEVLSNLGL